MSLAGRSSQPERMDTGCRDFEEYRRCLRDLARVNIMTMTHRPMLAWLKRQSTGMARFSLLDVACGYGDALRAIRRRYPDAELTGIDLNPWAIRAAAEATDSTARITFVNADVFASDQRRAFDFVISSQFTHHLTNEEIVRFIRWQRKHAANGWFIGDVHRHALAYFGFPVLARALFWHPIVREDGQISIARAFRRGEWEALLREAGIAPPDYVISWHIPFRLCVAGR